jgi:hypothetical protein
VTAVNSETGTRFCAWCGQPDEAAGEETHAKCRSRLAVLDPPRYCVHCARRMVVQVTPAGWHARCSRHGELTSN